ncbi:MAG: DUF4139 domain-containing protein [Deltaproteobacteria bacterium]|nr:DUF4139 domain-containing protein [Deltaproteobacteria bacterium]
MGLLLWFGLAASQLSPDTFAGLSKASPSSLEAPIESVTVFFEGGARVTRVARANVPRGLGRVAFPELPDTVDPESLRVSLKNGRLLRFDCEAIVRDPRTVEDLRKLATDAIELADLRRSLTDEIAALDGDVELIDRITLAPKQVDDLPRPPSLGVGLAGIDFFRARREARLAEMRKLRERVQQLERDSKELQSKFNKTRNIDSEAPQPKVKTLRVTASYEALEPELELTLEYAVPARWDLRYQILADPEANRFALNTQVIVAQTSREDWPRPRLLFSTAEAARDITLPTLSTWTLGESAELIPVVKSRAPPPFQEMFPAPQYLAPSGGEDALDALDRQIYRIFHPVSPGGKKYHGAPMSLHVDKVDIHEVIRKIGRVSGLQIAVDPSVSGNVTLHLSDMPWDRILDTLLWAHGLDKVRVGNVVRVASSSRLEAEEQQRLSRHEALEKLETTSTRLIRPERASAVALLEHIRPLLSQRGRVSADARTNSLIIDDVQEVLIQAERLIQVLDQDVDKAAKGSRTLDELDGSRVPEDELIKDEVSVVSRDRSESPPEPPAPRLALGGPLAPEEPTELERLGIFDQVLEAAVRELVPGLGTEVSVPALQQVFTGTIRHEVTPALSPLAFMSATVQNSDVPILGGPVRIYESGQLTGNAHLNPAGRRGRFELPLGVDENVKVTQDIVPSTTTEGFFSKSQVTRYAVRVSVSNQRTKPIELRIHEVLPTSDHPDVKVELVSSTPSARPTPEGMVDFEVSVPGGGRREVQLVYCVRRPARLQLIQRN